MQKAQRMSKKPCQGRVKEGGKSLKCLDIYREVELSPRGRVMSIKCLTHHHETGEKARDLVPRK